MTKGKKIVVALVSIVFIVAIVITIMASQALGWFHEGNRSEYAIDKIQPVEGSPLNGRTVIFLGSSVTDGMAAKGTSFADYIAKKNSVKMIKEAVSGTTLVDLSDKSYISRMKTNISTDLKADLFLCQLSTNDASKELPLGAISSSREIEDFDTSTIAGALEYITVYAGETWECPVAFYTGTYYDSPQYEEMVDLLYQLKEKYEITIIDMWNDTEMRSVSDEKYKLYMVDEIHPSQAGYLLWWSPVIEKGLIEAIN